MASKAPRDKQSPKTRWKPSERVEYIRAWSDLLTSLSKLALALAALVYAMGWL